LPNCFRYYSTFIQINFTCQQKYVSTVPVFQVKPDKKAYEPISDGGLSLSGWIHESIKSTSENDDLPSSKKHSVCSNQMSGENFQLRAGIHA